MQFDSSFAQGDRYFENQLRFGLSRPASVCGEIEMTQSQIAQKIDRFTDEKGLVIDRGRFESGK